MGIAIAAGVVAIGGAIAGGIMEKSAATKGRNAMDRALEAVQGVDIEKVKKLTADTDLEKYKRDFSAQEEVDPTSAALRKQGGESLLAGLTEGQANESQLLNTLQQEGLKDSPDRQVIIDQLIQGAKEELAQGATLSPEFQQELVRSGLEGAGSSGVSADYRAAAGVDARRLLGSAGEALKAQRLNTAGQRLSVAEQLKQNRLAILGNTLGVTENVQGARQNRAGQALAVGLSTVPSIGASGADVANLDIANTNLKNQVTIARGSNNAALEFAKGAANSKMIAGITSGVTGALGGMGGGGGGGVGSIFGGGGGGGAQLQTMGYATPSNFSTLPQQSQAEYIQTAQRNRYVNPYLYQ